MSTANNSGNNLRHAAVNLSSVGGTKYRTPLNVSLVSEDKKGF